MEYVHVVSTWGKGGGGEQEKGQNGRQATGAKERKKTAVRMTKAAMASQAGTSDKHRRKGQVGVDEQKTDTCHQGRAGQEQHTEYLPVRENSLKTTEGF